MSKLIFHSSFNWLYISLKRWYIIYLTWEIKRKFRSFAISSSSSPYTSLKSVRLLGTSFMRLCYIDVEWVNVRQLNMQTSLNYLSIVLATITNLEVFFFRVYTIQTSLYNSHNGNRSWFTNLFRKTDYSLSHAEITIYAKVEFLEYMDKRILLCVK